MVNVAIINDTRPTSHYGCMMVMNNLIKHLNSLGVNVLWTWPVSVDWRKHRKEIMRKPNVDAFIINGEGTIHNNSKRRFSQALVDFIGYASDQKKPCYLINATLHNNSNDAYEAISKARAVYVRDSGSLSELKKYGVLAKYVPDLTFGRKFSEMDRSCTEGIAVVDSAIKEDSLWLEKFAMANDYDFRSMVVARPGNARFLRSPRPYIKNLYRYVLKDRKISLDSNAYLLWLENHKFIVSGRYHTVTMCLKNRIPFVCLESNTPKVKFLLNDVFSHSNRSICYTDIYGAVNSEKFTSFSEDELECIDRFTNLAESEISKMFESILNDISNGVVGEFKY